MCRHAASQIQGKKTQTIRREWRKKVYLVSLITEQRLNLSARGAADNTWSHHGPGPTITVKSQKSRRGG